jgi:hypothetical protein
MNAGRLSVSLTIRYRNPKRGDEAGMTMIVGQAEAGAMVAQLEKRGFIVDKITFAPSVGAAPVEADRPMAPASTPNLSADV